MIENDFQPPIVPVMKIKTTINARPEKKIKRISTGMEMAITPVTAASSGKIKSPRSRKIRLIRIRACLSKGSFLIKPAPDMANRGSSPAINKLVATSPGYFRTKNSGAPKYRLIGHILSRYEIPFYSIILTIITS